MHRRFILMSIAALVGCSQSPDHGISDARGIVAVLDADVPIILAALPPGTLTFNQAVRIERNVRWAQSSLADLGLPDKQADAVQQITVYAGDIVAILQYLPPGVISPEYQLTVTAMAVLVNGLTAWLAARGVPPTAKVHRHVHFDMTADQARARLRRAERM